MFPGQSRKFHKPWSGPYTVVKKLSDVTYRVCLPQSKRKRLVVHFDRLKRCSENLRWDTQLNPGSTEPQTTFPFLLGKARREGGREGGREGVKGRREGREGGGRSVKGRREGGGREGRKGGKEGHTP